MPRSRHIATLAAVGGLGMVSGSLAQVASLDGPLKRAVQERRAPEAVEAVSRDCPRHDRERAKPRAAPSRPA
jgi:hypothetical protein